MSEALLPQVVRKHRLEFSHRTRAEALKRFRSETFDLLVIGGGITGAGVARDAASRGLSVALVERNDFAYGTSSRSSKLIHGGLRYLQNFELGLVFEALSERAHLLKTVPHMVRPLPFYLPVYKSDSHGMGIFSVGLWLYDLLALFRTPGFHRRLSKKKILEQMPYLNEKGLVGGFRYYDASMWDDVLAVETLRSAQAYGAVVANYTEAVEPVWANGRVEGFTVRDRESAEGAFAVRAKRVVVCAGPWTDQVGRKISPQWRNWLSPSKGVHLIFDLKRIPVPGAMVMTNPDDGRISFVIPRPDMGAGVAIVGTTDGPSPREPGEAAVDPVEVQYLMSLLQRYFPNLNLKTSDILSAYVGVRPLVEHAPADAADTSAPTQAEQASGGKALQKVSREHHIDRGPGGTVVVAGGKYTTYRRMAQEVVDFTLTHWHRDAREGKAPAVPAHVKHAETEGPVNPEATAEAVARARLEAASAGITVPEELWRRFGGEALAVAKLQRECSQPAGFPADPEGFPYLAAQLRYTMREGMVMHLEDFYIRRNSLYLSRADHGLPWAEGLARVWAEERGLGASEIQSELDRLNAELAKRSAWQAKLSGSTASVESLRI